MGAEMQDGVGAVVLPQPAVEGGEGVGRREALLEEQPHRVALVAEAGLDADEDVAEALAQDEQALAVGELPAGCRAPGALDLVEMSLLADMLVDRRCGGRRWHRRRTARHCP